MRLTHRICFQYIVRLPALLQFLCLCQFSDGTALDASLMMLHLPSFLFPDSKQKITKHLVLGVSLGGHAAWLSLFNEPSVSAAVVVIGCPDYARLMGERAAKCKRKSWTGTYPHGAGFIGSTDFPWSLQTAMERYDPAGVLLSELDVVTGDDYLHEPTDEEIRRLRPIMQSRLGGKRILNLAGGADKLVPYKCSEPFFAFLNRAIDNKTGWFADGGVEFIDKRYGGVGHEFTQEMLQEAVKFIGDTVASDEEKRGRASKL
jgi:pimeloyl-ACP methyl ester carboxylesterase